MRKYLLCPLKLRSSCENLKQSSECLDWYFLFQANFEFSSTLSIKLLRNYETTSWGPQIFSFIHLEAQTFKTQNNILQTLQDGLLNSNTKEDEDWLSEDRLEKQNLVIGVLLGYRASFLDFISAWTRSISIPGDLWIPPKKFCDILYEFY